VKKPSKHTAKERIARRVSFALDTASYDLPRSKRALETAFEIVRKYNVRGAPILKRYFRCHGCKEAIIPGRTAKIRVSSGRVKSLAITCSMCGQTYRIPLTKKGARPGRSSDGV